MRNNNSSSFRFLIHSRPFPNLQPFLGRRIFFFLLHVAVSSGLNAVRQRQPARSCNAVMAPPSLPALIPSHFHLIDRTIYR